MTRPTLALSVGCPAGVGPEIALTAAARCKDAAVILVGDEALLCGLAERAGLAKRLVAVEDARALPRGKIGLWAASQPLAAPVAPGVPSAAAGAAQLAWVDQACDLARSGACDALVTGPVSKQWIATGTSRVARRFRGHTEHLAERLGAREVVMAFVGGSLATSLVTTHLPLRRVAAAIRQDNVATSCFWLAHLLARLRPPAAEPARIAVAGLNPHAGEGGLLGDEELRHIAPGMKRARTRLRRARIAAELVGPLGAESAYRLAADGTFAGVVAMYHDQATIAGKLLGFGELTNITLGLPIIRTSVDHGTAYDRAGKGTASDAGMHAALVLAVRLARGQLGTRP
jgi:4-hydroxythreonine-4-phosphate dehydrogenase